MVGVLLNRLGVHFNTRTHSAGKINALDVGSLGHSRFELDERLHELSSILHDSIRRERYFTDRGVYNTEFVNLEVDLTLLHFLDSLSHVHGNSTGLGVRHQAARTEDTTEGTDFAHDSRHGDDHIHVSPATFDLIDIFIQTNIIGSGLFSRSFLVCSTQCKNTHLLTCSVGQLFGIRVYYLQARSASENGTLLAPQGTLFYFESYALTEMVINSLGGLPPEAYYPAGFASLIEHDKDGGISYLQTLTAFLEENMSYTATAKRLYIHRSTLIDRISRIERELGIDLRDSDRRLQLEILLKAMSIEELMRSN